jgi:PAS domain S-box-containing protein
MTNSAAAATPETFEQFVLDRTRVEQVMDDVYAKGDRMMRLLVAIHALITIVLAPIYGTWLLSLAIGGAATAMFFCSVALLPGHRITRMIAGVSLQTFVALHIYQMHGLPEMHFFFFTAFTAMVVYQDGLSMWPGALLIIGQHLIFALLQNSGVNLYFFPDRFIGWTKLFFHFGIAIFQVVLCGWWAVSLRQRALLDAFQRTRLHASQAQLQADMAARMEAERALAAREAEARLAIVANHTSNGVFIADPQGRIEWVNRAFEGLAGATHAESSGQTRFELLSKVNADAGAVARLEGELATSDEASLEVQVTIAGQPRWLYLQMKRVRQEDGQVARIIGVEIDVTARKRAEEEVVRAQMRAEDASRAKGDFLATMSHEMRTPLNGILGMSDMLVRSELTARQAEQLETLRTCADNLLALVNDVLDLSKIDAGKLEISDHAYEPRLLVDDVLAMNAVRAQTKGIELVAIVSRAVPEVLVGDMARARQTLTNLVANGVKFTTSGEVEVRVDVEQPSAGAQERTLRFVVRDTGIGVDKATQATLFTPFTQADGSISRRFGGSGLGLAISKRLVEAMGGTIGLESEVGRGSSFYFTLPCIPGPEPSTRTALAGRLACIVSPHAGTRAAFVELLSPRGISARGVASVDGARAMGSRVDLILVDGCLPPEDIDALATHFGHEKLIVMGRSGTPSLGEDIVCFAWPLRNAPLENAVMRVLDPDRASAHPAERGLAWRSAPGQRILLVEDNPINQVVAQSLLEDLGLTVSIAGDGEQGLKALQTQAFDLVLMDCQMPILDGFEATRRWRSQEVGKRTPIVALTAQAMSGDDARCKSAGMDDYLPKPIERRLLIATLQQYLAGTDGNAPASSGAAPPSYRGDIEALREFLQMFGQSIGPSALAKVTGTIATEMPADVAKLRKAAGLTGGQAEHDPSLARIAHALRGATRTVGLTALGDRLLELEEAAGKDPFKVKALATEVSARLDAVCSAMKDASAGGDA